MRNGAHVVLLGLDAGDKDLIVEWARAGLLPTFARLLRTGAVGVTTSPPGLFVGAVWPSFTTGLSPAEHGRYCFRQIRSGSYSTHRVRSRDVAGTPFWSELGRAGKRVAIIDVPKTTPVHGLNGLQIVDWATHDGDFSGVRTWPRSLGAEVVARFGRDDVGDCNAERRHATEFTRLRDGLIDRIERKTALTLDVLARERWDFAASVFSESHCIGHQCWHLHDATHPWHDPALARATGDPMRDVYVALDRALGRVLDALPADTTTIVLASHGMAAHYDGTFLLDRILERLDHADMPGAFQVGVAAGASRAWYRMPPALRRWVKPVTSRVRTVLSLDPQALRFRRRRCFPVPNNTVCGGIRVNLIGREPHGTIRRGEDYDAYCAALSADLLALVNVETGDRVVERVRRIDELYRGSRLDDLPDLIVEWNHTAPIAAVRSDKIGTVSDRYRGPRSGDHRPEGLMIVSGPGIVPGPVEGGVAITDLAPTIADLLGVRLPRTDGHACTPRLFAAARAS